MSIIERGPSFFRKGGLLLPEHQQWMEVGRNQDGSWYIDIKGKVHVDVYGNAHVRAILTPEKMEKLADGVFEKMGLTYDNARTNGKGI